MDRLPEYTLQQYIDTQLVGVNKQTIEAGGALLTFDKTAQTATFKDPEGNETVYNASPPQYYVSFLAEGTSFQKNYIRILEKSPSSMKLQLVDPTEALF